MIWREKRIPLAFLGVLLLANAVFFFTYRVQYENRLSALESDKHAAEQRLEQLRARRAQTERQIATYRKAQAEIATIYNQRWSTLPERFTALVNEVKRLETASQLIGRSHGFAQSEKDTKEAAGLGTNVVTISFSVQGTYAQVRRLINLLELSDQFVIIDSISLGANNGTAADRTLTLNIRLKTLFRDTRTTAPLANKQL